MKKGIKKTICILLTAISCISLAGCGEAAVGQADIDPQTPIEEVAFPLSEQKNCHLLRMHLPEQSRILIKERYL